MAIKFQEYEPLNNQFPNKILARHPSGLYLLMTITQTQDCAIWDTRTKKIYWKPENGSVKTAVWLQQGSQLVFILVNKSNIKEMDYFYVFYRIHWPDMKILSSIPYEPCFEGMFKMTIAPSESLAVVQWVTQGSSGWDFIFIDTNGDKQLKEAGFEVDGNDAYRIPPIYSPDNSYLVSGYHTLWIRNQYSYVVPKIQEGFEVGCVTIIHTKTGVYRHIIIDDMISQKDHRLAKFRKLQPQFYDITHCGISLGGKTNYIIDLSTETIIKN